MDNLRRGRVAHAEFKGLRGAQIGQGPGGHAKAFGCDHKLLEGFNQRIQRRLGPIWKKR